MREIKFRAWDKHAKEFVKPIFHAVGWLDDGLDYPKHIVLMQYTGLKDKNGKEIYEGDIIWYGLNLTGDKYMGKVVFAEAGFNLKSPLSTELLPLYGADMIEIIGNIYENPELIGSDRDG